MDSLSTESDIFYVEGLSEEGSPARNNTPVVLNSTELSRTHERVASVASMEPEIWTIESDSNETTIPYGYGRQQPIILPSLIDLNFLPNPFIVLKTRAGIQPTKK